MNLLKSPKIENTCKGLFWKADTTAYFNHSTGAMNTTRRLRLLKRRSCSGCAKCSWFFEFMHEEVLNGLNDYSEKYLDGIENGKVYTFKLHTSCDWESSYEEIDEVEFVEVED